MGWNIYEDSCAYSIENCVRKIHICVIQLFLSRMRSVIFCIMLLIQDLCFHFFPHWLLNLMKFYRKKGSRRTFSDDSWVLHSFMIRCQDLKGSLNLMDSLSCGNDQTLSLNRLSCIEASSLHTVSILNHLRSLKKLIKICFIAFLTAVRFPSAQATTLCSFHFVNDENMLLMERNLFWLISISVMTLTGTWWEL